MLFSFFSIIISSLLFCFLNCSGIAERNKHKRAWKLPAIVTFRGLVLYRIKTEKNFDDKFDNTHLLARKQMKTKWITVKCSSTTYLGLSTDR